jgi:hypothetical protein
VHAGLAIVAGAHRHPLCHELLAQLDVVNHVAVVRPNQVAIRWGCGAPRTCPAQLRDSPAATICKLNGPP